MIQLGISKGKLLKRQQSLGWSAAVLALEKSIKTLRANTTHLAGDAHLVAGLASTSCNMTLPAWSNSSRLNARQQGRSDESIVGHSSTKAAFSDRALHKVAHRPAQWPKDPPGVGRKRKALTPPQTTPVSDASVHRKKTTKTLKAIKKELYVGDDAAPVVSKKKKISMVDLTLDSSTDGSNDSDEGDDVRPAVKKVKGMHSDQTQPRMAHDTGQGASDFDWLKSQNELMRFRSKLKGSRSTAGPKTLCDLTPVKVAKDDSSSSASQQTQGVGSIDGSLDRIESNPLPAKEVSKRHRSPKMRVDEAIKSTEQADKLLEDSTLVDDGQAGKDSATNQHEVLHPSTDTREIPAGPVPERTTRIQVSPEARNHRATSLDPSIRLHPYDPLSLFGTSQSSPDEVHGSRARPVPRHLRTLFEQTRAQSDAELEFSLAKYSYEVLQAEAIGPGEANEVIEKRIKIQVCKVELAHREIAWLQAKLA